MGRRLVINGRILREGTINDCVNKNKCVGCQQPYHGIILITKTGIGFCSASCMTEFMIKWRTSGDDIAINLDTGRTNDEISYVLDRSTQIILPQEEIDTMR